MCVLACFKKPVLKGHHVYTVLSIKRVMDELLIRN